MPHRHTRLLMIVLAIAAGTGRTGFGQSPDSSSASHWGTEGFLTTADGVRLHYRVAGSGQPVVLVPGGLFLERDFARLAHGRTLIFYDMRGRGRSDHVADSSRISIANDVDDLEAVRRHFGADRFIPLGWSYLGMMVMRYAAKHPERVERIALIGPLGRRYGTVYPDSLLAQDSVPVPDAASLAMLTRLSAEGLPARDPGAYCERDYEVNRVRLVGNPRLADRVPDLCAMPNEWPTNLRRHFVWLFTSIVRDEPPSWEQFARLDVPVLIIHGTMDRNAPYGGGREWAAHLPEARLVTIPGAAHMVWLDAPDAVFSALEAFLGSP